MESEDLEKELLAMVNDSNDALLGFDIKADISLENNSFRKSIDDFLGCDSSAFDIFKEEEEKLLLKIAEAQFKIEQFKLNIVTKVNEIKVYKAELDSLFNEYLKK